MDLENLTELYWDDAEGKFYTIRWDSEQEVSVQEREIDSRKLEPIGDAHYVIDDGKTPYREVMHNILKVNLSAFSASEAYKRINAYSFASLSLVANKDKPRDDSLAGSYPWVTVNFYHLYN